MRGETGDPDLERLSVTVHRGADFARPEDRHGLYPHPECRSKEPKALEALNRNRKYIRGLVAPKLDMKFMPDIRFRIDTALDYASKIDEILRRPDVARDLKTEE